MSERRPTDRLREELVRRVRAAFNEDGQQSVTPRDLFAPVGVDVRALRLDRRGSWSLQLANGIDVLVGSREARSRLDRFARLLPRLITQRGAPDQRGPLLRADLRYTNGFALTWGATATP